MRALPRRMGPRPETGPAMPHQQLTQNAPPELQEALMPPTALMVFGPRDSEELEVVWTIVQASHAFARGPADLPG